MRFNTLAFSILLLTSPVAHALTQSPLNKIPGSKLILPTSTPTPSNATPAETPPPSTTPAPASNAELPQDLKPYILKITLNGQTEPNFALVFTDKKNQQAFFVSIKDLTNWNIQLPPNMTPRIIRGQAYYNFAAIPGSTEKLDVTTEAATLTLPAQYFKAQRFDLRNEKKLIPQLPHPGGFFNYDVFSQKVTSEAGSSTPITSGFFELGAFGPAGSGTSDFLVTNGANQNRVTRLNTAWNIDYPNTMRTLRIGDGFNNPGMWSNSVDFGGVSWGSNFTTQPNFLSFPLPFVSGSAIAPSLAEIYLNNSLVNNENLNSGPFNFQNLPVVTGAGDVRMVVTNLLGKKEVVDIPYYADQELLKPGLHQFSLDSGFIRDNFGLHSNDYGQFLISGTNAFGITNNLTTELHTELRSDIQTVGAGEHYLIGDLGVLSSAVALSHQGFDYGELAQLGFNHLSQHFSYGFKTQLMSKQFHSIGFGDNGFLAPSAQSQAFLSVPVFKQSSIGFSYISQINRNFPNEQIVTSNYSFQPLHDVSMTLTGLMDLNNQDNKAILLTTSINLSQNLYAYTTASHENNSNSLSAELQHAAPVEGGVGYTIGGGTGTGNHYTSAGINYLHPYGSLQANVAHDQGMNDYQAEVNGGAVFLDKQFYLTRYSGNSFALVKVPGQKDVPVLLENVPVAKTNNKGYALVTGLIPYVKNEISINPNDLSLNTDIQSTQIDVAPYAHSGALVSFPIHTITSATLTLKQADGQPVPVGASLNLTETKESSLVGNHGFVYLTNLQAKNTLVASWDGHTCQATILYRPNGAIQQNLGTETCQEKS